jgi:hypothetical protein
LVGLAVLAGVDDVGAFFELRTAFIRSGTQRLVIEWSVYRCK